MDHAALVSTAWAKPSNTKNNFPSVDINAILSQHYHGPNGTPISLSRTQLWELEKLKAVDPEKYLTPLIRNASRSPSTLSADGRFEEFTIVSEKRCLKDPAAFNLTIEHARLDNHLRTALFIGVDEWTTPEGKRVRADRKQPLIYVERIAAGTEDRPVEEFRMVVLTEEVDEEMLGVLAKIGDRKYLSGFVELYIRQDLGLDLQRIGDDASV